MQYPATAPLVSSGPASQATINAQPFPAPVSGPTGMGAERPKTPTTQTGVELAKPNTPPTQAKVAPPSQPGAGPNASALVNRQVPGSDSEGVKTLLESIAIQMKRTVSTTGTGPKAWPKAGPRFIESLRLPVVQQVAPAARSAAITTGLASAILASSAKAGAGASTGAGAGSAFRPNHASGLSTPKVPSDSKQIPARPVPASMQASQPQATTMGATLAPLVSQTPAITKAAAGSAMQTLAAGSQSIAAHPAFGSARVLASQPPTNQPNQYWAFTERTVPRQIGGTMLSPEGVNMMPRPNTVYVEGAAAGVRIEPEQARTLGLRAGETITAIVAQRQDGNILLIGNQQLPLPDRMNLPTGQVSLLVRMIAGQTILTLTDPALAASVAAANSRVDADGRFTRLLNHVGSFHLLQLFAPGQLGALAEKVGSPELRSALAALLLDSRQLSSTTLRQAFQNTGLFAEHQAGLNPNQALPGLKSMLLTLRSLMQARQMETTSISGAIDELEARQVDSLAQQSAGRSHYSWMISFADQYPVFLDLQHHKNSDSEGAAQETWTVDLEVGLTPSVSMAANARVSVAGELGLRLWLPDSSFYQLAQAGRGQLEAMLSQNGLTLAGLAIYPVPRDAGSVNHGQQRLGVSIDA
ncbi:MAG: hypothetical protein VXY44_01540 [Pseudomonadota bacterium]|nr:hypothetical protein [Pseudomonadota bacterium]